jgi:hypothetical protein
MSTLGIVLIVILVIALFGGFRGGLGRGYGYGYGHGGMGLIGLLLVIILILMLLNRIWSACFASSARSCTFPALFCVWAGLFDFFD